jgi:hypothetical protein
MRVIGPLSIGLLTEFVVFIIALTQVKFFSKQALKLNRPIKSYLYILGMACCIVVGMLLNNLSLTLLPVSMIVLIPKSFSFLIAINEVDLSLSLKLMIARTYFVSIFKSIETVSPSVS